MTTILPGIPSTVQRGVVEIAGATIPVVGMPRFDERQTCRTVLKFQAGVLEGKPDDYQTCPAYRNYECRMQGGGALCAFHEGDNAPVWRKAARWRLLELPDGSTTATPAGCALEVAHDLGAVIVGAQLVEVR